MSEDEAFGLSDETLEIVESTLAEGLCQGHRGGPHGASQVLFFDAEAAAFAAAWEAKGPGSRWAFAVHGEGVGLVFYVCKRLRDLGDPVRQLLFATAGAGALFYATPAASPRDSAGVVGLLPRDTSGYDFGLTVYSYAPDAELRVVCNQTAADQDFDGRRYRGVELIGPLATYLNGVVLASDQDVSWYEDGTAVTPGNLWMGDPATGLASIKYPAPGNGQVQSFPL